MTIPLFRNGLREMVKISLYKHMYIVLYILYYTIGLYSMFICMLSPCMCAYMCVVVVVCGHYNRVYKYCGGIIYILYNRKVYILTNTSYIMEERKKQIITHMWESSHSGDTTRLYIIIGNKSYYRGECWNDTEDKEKLLKEQMGIARSLNE